MLYFEMQSTDIEISKTFVVVVYSEQRRQKRRGGCHRQNSRAVMNEFFSLTHSQIIADDDHNRNALITINERAKRSQLNGVRIKIGY